MTQYEERFYAIVPTALKEIAEQLKRLNNNLEKARKENSNKD